MTPIAVGQLIAVVVGGLLATLGGIVSALLLDRHRRDVTSRNLALAFKGEITALLEYIEERRYAQRFEEVASQIETTGKPFYMPFRIRFAYDRVYQGNVSQIGLLRGRLPELIPAFYTRLTAMMEDLLSLGDGTYAGLDQAVLLRIYRDLQGILNRSVGLGKEIVAEIDAMYGSDGLSEEETR